MANRGGYTRDVYKAAVRGARIVVAAEPEEARAHMLLGIAIRTFHLIITSRSIQD